MDSSEASSSPFDLFKSKKVLRSTVNKPHFSDPALNAPDQSPWSSKTPEKPINPPRRPVIRRQALLSVNQVREAAKKLRTSDPNPSVPPEPLSSSAELTQTPITKSSTSKSLPKKYEMLNEFFNGLECSIRLLGLKGSRSTFTNISRTIESLTDRRFAHSHLAQLKFIFPEAIEIKKILVRDDRTSCMKPDLHVTLNFNVDVNDEKLKSDSGKLQLRKLFQSRLWSFCKTNPMGDEVPQEMLPEPFNQPSKVLTTDAIKESNLGSLHESTNAVSAQQPVLASHMPQSFKRRFSKQVPSHKVEKLEQDSSRLAPETRALSVSKQVTEKSSIKERACASKLPETPIKSFDLEKDDISSMGATSIDGTPAKVVLSPSSATPVQEARPPRKCLRTPDDNSMASPSKLARRSSGRRSITFDTPVKNKTPSAQRVSRTDDDIFDILSEDLLESIKEKERKALEEKDPAISQAKWRKQMIAGLPRLFDILLFFFQSIKRSVITKEELVHRIISSHLEIVDRREVDEQLRLLQELAPEWIYEKMASTGDLLFCINKISSPELIRARLEEAHINKISSPELIRARLEEAQ